MSSLDEVLSLGVLEDDEVHCYGTLCYLKVPRAAGISWVNPRLITEAEPTIENSLFLTDTNRPGTDVGRWLDHSLPQRNDVIAMEVVVGVDAIEEWLTADPRGYTNYLTVRLLCVAIGLEPVEIEDPMYKELLDDLTQRVRTEHADILSSLRAARSRVENIESDLGTTAEKAKKLGIDLAPASSSNTDTTETSSEDQ